MCCTLKLDIPRQKSRTRYLNPGREIRRVYFKLSSQPAIEKAELNSQSMLCDMNLVQVDSENFSIVTGCNLEALNRLNNNKL